MINFEDRLVKEIYSDRFKKAAKIYYKSGLEDALQETARIAMENKQKFLESEGIGNLGGWLHTILRNNFLNEYKVRKRRKTFYTENPGAYSSATCTNEYEKKSEKETLLYAINKISSSGREVIMLGLEGYDSKGIAKELSLPKGTVCSRVFNAKDDLRKIYSGKTRRKCYKKDPVYQIDKKSGKLVNKFINVLEASEHTKICDARIYKALCGTTKSAGGFIWERESKFTA